MERDGAWPRFSILLYPQIPRRRSCSLAPPPARPPPPAAAHHSSARVRAADALPPQPLPRRPRPSSPAAPRRPSRLHHRARRLARSRAAASLLAFDDHLARPRLERAAAASSRPPPQSGGASGWSRPFLLRRREHQSFLELCLNRLVVGRRRRPALRRRDARGRAVAALQLRGARFCAAPCCRARLPRWRDCSWVAPCRRRGRASGGRRDVAELRRGHPPAPPAAPPPRPEPSRGVARGRRGGPPAPSWPRGRRRRHVVRRRQSPSQAPRARSAAEAPPSAAADLRTPSSRRAAAVAVESILEHHSSSSSSPSSGPSPGLRPPARAPPVRGAAPCRGRARRRAADGARVDEGERLAVGHLCGGAGTPAARAAGRAGGWRRGPTMAEASNVGVRLRGWRRGESEGLAERQIAPAIARAPAARAGAGSRSARRLSSISPISRSLARRCGASALLSLIADAAAAPPPPTPPVPATAGWCRPPLQSAGWWRTAGGPSHDEQVGVAVRAGAQRRARLAAARHRLKVASRDIRRLLRIICPRGRQLHHRRVLPFPSSRPSASALAACPPRRAPAAGSVLQVPGKSTLVTVSCARESQPSKCVAVRKSPARRV